MKKYINIILLVFIQILGSSCSEEWLTPEPKSFYSPENTFINPEGLEAALVACLQSNRAEFYGEGTGEMTENLFSDLVVEGSTDKAGPAMDLPAQILPDAELNSHNHNRIGWFWVESFKRIKYANVVVSRIDDIEWESEEQRNHILGKAYFHRARTYYRLTHQFGDVPLILEEINGPRLDFHSVTRESILQKCKKDLDFAAEWVKAESEGTLIGDINKAAVNHLLTKVNLALLEFDDAIASASAVIDNGYYALMTQRFGVDKDDPTHDIIWDLHQESNRALPENTEKIYVLTSNQGFTEDGASVRIETMKAHVPFYAIGGGIKTPTGLNGMSFALGEEIDIATQYGRGIGRNRPTNYSQFEIWDDPNDLRHTYPNWIRMEDMVYNHPGLKEAGDPYYGQNLQKYDDDGNILVADTIRSWYEWPHYKIYMADPTHVSIAGGYGNWYCYRLAETYLLRAEAYFWKGELQSAVDDINPVRTRAGCAPMNASEVNIGTILDERARELFLEEPRKTELTRIAYILAKSGVPSYSGKTYSLNNFSEDNFWYDRVYEKNNFYRDNIEAPFYTYDVAPWLVLWPIPANVLNANSLGHINQNKGYPGDSDYKTPWIWVDGEGEGEIVEQ